MRRKAYGSHTADRIPLIPVALKFQYTNPKFQAIPKSQITIFKHRFVTCPFVICLVFGICYLAISLTACRNRNRLRYRNRCRYPVSGIWHPASGICTLPSVLRLLSFGQGKGASLGQGQGQVCLTNYLTQLPDRRRKNPNTQIPNSRQYQNPK